MGRDEEDYQNSEPEAEAAPEPPAPILRAPTFKDPSAVEDSRPTAPSKPATIRKKRVRKNNAQAAK